jgi:hypothetical protein
MSTLSIKEKSVHININSQYYGTIAEIGGGQETARHLFQAGGASNTVAKSISAYDKLFSDHFYNQGEPSRYVSEDRLRKMVCSEYDELIKILDHKNPKRFFAFANTVETINYTKTNLGKGWLGMAIEGTDRYQPNLFFIHVKLHENDTLLQQYSLGALGINLIHGGLFDWENPHKILLALLDNLDTSRIEVDYAYVEGPDMKQIDNRLLNLMLVSNGMTPAVMFDNHGHIQHPGDMLYRKNVLLMRGYFRPINNLGVEFIEDSLEIFKRDEAYKEDNTIALSEISLNYLMEGEQLNEKDFLHRVDLLNLMGQCVMISNFKRYFELAQYFTQYKLIKLRIVLGLPTFEKIIDSCYYSDLKGGILEALGDLFQDNVKVYLYPAINSTTGQLTYPDNNYFKGKKSLLWQYLVESLRIVQLKSLSSKNLYITSEKVKCLIENADDELKDFLPEKVYNHIKRHRLFDFGKNKEITS